MNMSRHVSFFIFVPADSCSFYFYSFGRCLDLFLSFVTSQRPNSSWSSTWMVRPWAPFLLFFFLFGAQVNVCRLYLLVAGQCLPLAINSLDARGHGQPWRKVLVSTVDSLLSFSWSCFCELLMKNYNSKKEDLEEEDQRQDERDVGQGFLLPRILLAFR